jgi:hypothetical protein
MALCHKHAAARCARANAKSAVTDIRTDEEDGVTSLTAEAVDARRQRQVTPDRVVFRVSGLYGLCPSGVKAPLGGAAEPIDSGPIAVTIDPDADPSCNLGVIEYAGQKLTVRYGVLAVFPALYELASSGSYDPGLFTPVRMVATDDCTLTPNLMGWRALGCLDFLPGSIWAGAAGG